MEVRNINDIPTLYAVLEKYADLLVVEQDALVASRVDPMNDIVRKKVDILNVFANINSDLLTALSAPSTLSNNADLARVRDLLGRCKILNAENSALINQGLKVCRNSIRYLNRDSGPSVSPLYNGKGMVADSVVNRSIGKA